MIAKSFERIHCSNLAGMCIVPLCFKAGEDADSGAERDTDKRVEKVDGLQGYQEALHKRFETVHGSRSAVQAGPAAG